MICNFINIDYISKHKTVFKLYCKCSLWKGLFLFWARPAKHFRTSDSACLLKTLRLLMNLSIGRKGGVHCSKYIWIKPEIHLIFLEKIFYYFSQCLGPKTTGTIILLKEEIFQALLFLLFFLFKHPGFVHSSKNQLNYNSPSDSHCPHAEMLVGFRHT